MKNKEVISKLEKIKESVTALGIQYITSKIPVEIESISKLLDPIVIIEISISKAIKHFKDEN